MPPEPEIAFEIHLLPGSTSISILPYGILIAEISGLKKQLKELLKQGFIRHSTSPRGALVLFVKKKDGTL